MLEEIQRIHISGIDGGRAAAMARVLAGRGIEVSGSATRSIPALDGLREAGIAIESLRSDRDFDDIDLVVAPSEHSDGNPEFDAARRLDVAVVDEAAVLRHLIDTGRSIAVTGTHGRATVSAMISWILDCAGRDPGFIVSTRAHNFGVEGRDGGGEWFVVELDERVASHHEIHCDYVVCNFLEADSRGFYGGIDELVEAMQQFLESNHCLKEAFINLDCLGNRELVSRAALRPTGYALEHRAEFRGERIPGSEPQFTAFHRDLELGEFSLSIPGGYNAVNALGALAVAYRLGIDIDVIAEALRTFEGLENRYTVATGGGVTIVKDFVRHPTAVGRVMRSVLSERADEDRVVAVCQLPSPIGDFGDIDAFADALDGCDEVLLVDADGRDDPAVEQLSSVLTERVDKVIEAEDGQDVESHLVDHSAAGDIAVFFGDDDLLRHADHIQAALAARAAETKEEGDQPRFDGPLAEGGNSDD